MCSTARRGGLNIGPTMDAVRIIHCNKGRESVRHAWPLTGHVFATEGRPMKRAFMVVALAATSVAGLVHAEEPPSLVQAEEAQPAREGFARGSGPGQWNAPQFIEDRKWFHFLLDNRAKIRRTTTRTAEGVETVTESDHPEVAAGIQTHVAAMHARLKEGRGIHLRDPLFREVFRHADKISMKITDTDKGVRVVEISDDPYVASLIQAHADVVSQFIKNGHDEVRKNHAVPQRPD